MSFFNQRLSYTRIHKQFSSVIINTGSKQGITNPPGNAAYNASKAAVKSLTEGLAHELRQIPGTKLTAHLFVPGWTFTGMTGAGAGCVRDAALALPCNSRSSACDPAVAEQSSSLVCLFTFLRSRAVAYY